MESGARRDYKAEARAQWTANPCGGLPSGEPMTAEDFAAIDQDR